MSVKGLLRDSVKLIYPDRCLFCDAVVEANAFCCSRCRRTLSSILADYCIYCGVQASACRCGQKSAKPFRWLVGAVEYTAPVRQAITRFKFGGRREAAGFFAEMMAQSLLKRAAPLQFDAITCVPMSLQKQRRRGYNQSELLAKELAARLKIPYQPQLLRRSGILTQHDLSGRFRRLGAKTAFHPADPEKIRGRSILLVDDIVTTGSTLEQCAWALRDAGAADVCCTVFAQARKMS